MIDISNPDTVRRWQRVIGAEQDGHYGPKSRLMAIQFLSSLGVTLPRDKRAPDMKFLELCEARLVVTLIDNLANT